MSVKNPRIFGPFEEEVRELIGIDDNAPLTYHTLHVNQKKLPTFLPNITIQEISHLDLKKENLEFIKEKSMELMPFIDKLKSREIELEMALQLELGELLYFTSFLLEFKGVSNLKIKSFIRDVFDSFRKKRAKLIKQGFKASNILKFVKKNYSGKTGFLFELFPEIFAKELVKKTLKAVFPKFNLEKRFTEKELHGIKKPLIQKFEKAKKDYVRNLINLIKDEKRLITSLTPKKYEKNKNFIKLRNKVIEKATYLLELELQTHSIYDYSKASSAPRTEKMRILLEEISWHFNKFIGNYKHAPYIKNDLVEYFLGKPIITIKHINSKH